MGSGHRLAPSLRRTESVFVPWQWAFLSDCEIWTPQVPGCLQFRSSECWETSPTEEVLRGWTTQGQPFHWSSSWLKSSWSPRNNEAWAVPEASFACCHGSTNELRWGLETPCCYLRARVCQCDSAVAVAVAVGRAATARGARSAQRRGRVARRSPETTPGRGAAAMSVAGLKKQFHKASQVGRRA